MKILMMIPYVPNLIRVRPYNLIRYLARRGHRVTLLTVWTSSQERDDAQALEPYCERVEALHLPAWRSGLNCLGALPSQTPLQAVYSWHPDLVRQAARLLDQFDVVHVEHLRGAQYGLALKSMPGYQDHRLPIVWDSVDCISYLFEQAVSQSQSLAGRVMTRVELTRTRRHEGWLASQFERVLVTSRTDQARLDKLRTACCPPEGAAPPICVVPNGVDLDYFAPGSQPRQSETIVFSGKMSYHANVTAALYLGRHVMPLVWEARPQARLVIAGSNPAAAVRELAQDSRVQVTGFVPDLRLPLQTASLAVAPLLYGAGIQNKVLEAMACGTPVVASPLAISALAHIQPGEDCRVADSPQAYAEEIVELLDARATRESLGAAGRRYVETYHNWDTITAELENIYESVENVQPTAV